MSRSFRAQAVSAGAIVLLVMFAVLTIGGTEPWAHAAIQVAVFAMLAFWIGWYVMSNHAVPMDGVGALLWLVPAWGTAQLLLGRSEYCFATRNAIVDGALVAALYCVSRRAFQKSRVRRLALQTLVVFGFLVSVAALLAHFTEPGKIFWIIPLTSGDPFGPFVNRNHYCVFVELTLPIALFLAMDDRSLTKRFVWAGMSGTLIASAAVAASRAGCALIASEVILAPAVMLLRKKRPTREVWAGLGAMVALATILTGAGGWQQLVTRFSEHDPFAGRRELLLSAALMTHDRPWTGFGLGAFETVYPAYALFDNGLRVDHAHNDWAEWAATGGMPLVAVFGLVFFITLPRALRSGWAIGIAAMYLHALVDFPFEIPALAVLHAVLLGSLAVAHEQAYET